MFCFEGLLRKFSKIVTSNDKLYDIGLGIGLRHHHIEEARTNNQNSITLAAFCMLLTWRNIFLICPEDEDKMIQKLYSASQIAKINNDVLKEIPEIAERFLRSWKNDIKCIQYQRESEGKFLIDCLYISTNLKFYTLLQKLLNK